jgi:hypothetical protein
MCRARQRLILCSRPNVVEHRKGHVAYVTRAALHHYLSDEFGIELHDPVVSEALEDQVVAAVREYWKKIHQDRRGGQEGPFSIHANRLAEHDAENFISVLSDRRMQAGKTPLGYTSWLLTLDSAARRMLQNLDPDVREKIRHSPIISVDFLLKYLAFGPSRDRIPQSAERMALPPSPTDTFCTVMAGSPWLR